MNSMTPRAHIVLALRDIQERIAICKSAIIEQQICPLAWAQVLGGIEQAVWGLANVIERENP
jgi:hypothetical protein